MPLGPDEYVVNNNENTSTPTDPVVSFTEAQVQALVTSIFNSVNTRISERIVQAMIAGDTKHVASADAVKTAVDGALAAAAAAQAKADANATKLDLVDAKVGDGTASAKNYTDEQIDELRTAVMGMNHWDIVPVTGALPETLEEKTIYLQRDSEEDTTWEMNILTSQGVANIGRTEIDLSNYWEKDNVNGIVNALFGSELFGTKMGELLSTSLTSYTDGTLDLRYWKKDEITELVAAVVADTSAVDSVAAALADKFYRKDNGKDIAALANKLKKGGGYVDDEGDDVKYLGFDRIYLQIDDLETYLGITGNLSAETVAAALKAITATADLSETYLAVAKLKELLGIDGELTVESVEQAILTIVQSNEVETVPITDEKINSIVAAAFSSTAPDLGSTTTEDPAMFNIVITPSLYGKVTSNISVAEAGDTVILTATPDANADVQSVVVTSGSGSNVAVASIGENLYSFIMPESHVAVTSTFRTLVY